MSNLENKNRENFYSTKNNNLRILYIVFGTLILLLIIITIIGNITYKNNLFKSLYSRIFENTYYYN